MELAGDGKSTSITNIIEDNPDSLASTVASWMFGPFLRGATDAECRRSSNSSARAIGVSLLSTKYQFRNLHCVQCCTLAQVVAHGPQAEIPPGSPSVGRTRPMRTSSMPALSSGVGTFESSHS